MPRTSWTKEIYDVDESFVWPLYPFQEVSDAQMWVEWVLEKDWWRKIWDYGFLIKVKKATSPSTDAGTVKKKWGYEITPPLGCMTQGFLSHEMGHIPCWKSKPHHGKAFINAYNTILTNILRDATVKGIRNEWIARGVPIG